MKGELLEGFLVSQPFMSISPSTGDDVVIDGEFRFSALYHGQPQVNDGYGINIIVPKNFPCDLPKITEVGGRIPRIPDFHVNGDGSLCLGSSLNLMIKLQEDPTLLGYSSKCIVPYLYAMSLKLDHGIDFIFGELKHDVEGLLDDYQSLFGLSEKDHVLPTLKCVLLKKRIANKKPCPCGCGKRLGKCRLNDRVRHIRRVLPKAWVRKYVTGE